MTEDTYSGFEDLDWFLSELSEQTDIKSLKTYFLNQIERLGYCAFDAYSIRSDTLNQPRQPGNFCVASYSLEYIYKYVEKGFVAQCPGLTQAGQSRLPFDYLEFLKQLPKTPAVTWQRALYQLNNIHHAWLVPLNSATTLDGVTVYMQGNKDQHREHFHRTRHTIHLISAYFYEALLGFDPSGELTELLNDLPSGFKYLSEREMACLKLCSQGKTNREISTCLAISENTVRFHMKNIFRKLDVSSRAHAISKVGGLIQQHAAL